jgi:AAA ATPase domain
MSSMSAEYLRTMHGVVRASVPPVRTSPPGRPWYPATVNVAARLEQNAAGGEILIGPVARQAVGSAARAESVGPLRLKGKQAPMTAYRLLGLDEDVPEPSRRFDLPFIGRIGELGELDPALDKSAAGERPRLVVVYGEPGTGKTRLVRAWLDRANSADRPVDCGAGRCRPSGDHGSGEEALVLARRAATAAARTDSPVVKAVAALDLAAVLRQPGRPGQAAEAAGSALRHYEGKGHRPGVRRAARLQAELRAIDRAAKSRPAAAGRSVAHLRKG